ncbi:hypothetical protein [Aeromonas bivalvium]
MASTWGPSDDGRVNITDGAKVSAVASPLDPRLPLVGVDRVGPAQDGEP